MKLVVSVVDERSENVYIEAISSCGIVRGRWHGRKVARESVVYCELSCDDTFALDANAFGSTLGYCSLELSGDGIRATARLNHVFEDSVGRFELGDGFLMVDLCEPADWVVGAWYQLHLSEVELYDTNL